jgi:hypothetical protein
MKRPQTPFKEEIMLSTEVREKSNGKMRSMRLLAVLLVPVAALILGAATPEVLAWGEWGTLEAKIIFETNFTDEDTGIQVFTDGDPWKKVWIMYPNGNLMISIMTWGKLKRFGLTELFSESNEPNWVEELGLSEILSLFPPGYYKFIAKTVEGEWLKGWALLSHDLPCAPDEDSLSPAEGEIKDSDEDVVISWDAVEYKLDNATGECPEDGTEEDEIEIEAYQVIVENLTLEKDFSIFLEAKDEDNQVTLPEEFVTPDSVYKYEVLAIAENGNQTIAEIPFFCTDLDPCDEPAE